MTVDELNDLPLPDGWRFTEVHQYDASREDWRVVLAPPDPEPSDGPHDCTDSDYTLHGCTSVLDVDRMLRVFLPHHGAIYPFAGGEQLTMTIDE